MAAVLGFLAVALGAFGAHALKLDGHAAEVYQTGARYHLAHAVVLAAIGLLAGERSRALRVAAWAFVGGVLVFSGSLYLLAVTGVKWLGAITPIGGVALLVGWGALFVAGVKRPP